MKVVPYKPLQLCFILSVSHCQICLLCLVDSRCLKSFRPGSSTQIVTFKTFPEKPSLLLGVCPNMLGHRLLPFICNLGNGGLRKETTTKLQYQVELASLKRFQKSKQKVSPILFTSQHSVKHCWHHDCPAWRPKMKKRTNSGYII
jgi:hypothetical protein